MRSEVLLDFVRRHGLLEWAWKWPQRYRDDARQCGLIRIWEVLQRHDDTDAYPLAARAACAARRGGRDWWRWYRHSRQANNLPVSEHVTENDRVASLDNVQPDYHPRCQRDHVAALELWDQLEVRLSKIPRPMADAIRPYFCEGATLKECAARSGRTVNQVRRILKTGRFPARETVAPGTVTSKVRQ